MKLANISVACALLFAGPAMAHYKFPSLILNGQSTGDFKFVRENTNNINPLLDLNSIDMRCNEGAASGASTETATVRAGDTVGFTLSNSIGHIGPMLVYMAKAPGSASSFDGSGNLWFKIHEWGADFSSGSINWPQLGLLDYSFKLPPSLPDGEYLLRIEHIGVHNAANANSAQFFLNCAQVRVTGGGSGNPGPLVSIPGLYNAEDPGIHFNNYYPPPKSYIIPGPPVWFE
ncbi:glycoside hydrolase [Aspergillus carlsbadensis]|nr:glycoside hydrolase [Aspergillus carlsbadensis]